MNWRRNPKPAESKPPTGDLTRLRSEYAARRRRLAGSDIYSPFNKANLFAIQQRQRDVLAALRNAGFNPLREYRILEMGCGSGGVLLEYLTFGATPVCLHGIDLLPGRVGAAHRRLPHLPLACADGQNLPYPSGGFDLVLQYTAFSSILDDGIREKMAQEMLRVLRPQGSILWYDFWLNPTNPQTRGLRPPEIRNLFPACHFTFKRVTLAPPLSRFLAPISWTAAQVLEGLRLLNSHYLALIRPYSSPSMSP